MDKRSISVSLEEARELYESGNETLKKLVLTAYTETELVSYESLMLGTNRYIECICLDHPRINIKVLKALNKLNNLAFVLNKGWKKLVGRGFFIAPWSIATSGITECVIDDWAILSHKDRAYPGIVYFKDKKDAVKALEIGIKEGWINDLK